MNFFKKLLTILGFITNDHEQIENLTTTAANALNDAHAAIDAAQTIADNHNAAAAQKISALTSAITDVTTTAQSVSETVADLAALKSAIPKL